MLFRSNPVTAISLYLDWQDTLVTLCIPPKHMSKETAIEIASRFENCIIFDNEKEMFDTFFQLIEDADVLTGWNSEGYDIPYMVNRVTRVMSKDDTRKFCLLGQLPKPRTYERFGKEETTYDLVGRIHMDYLQLYKKYNYEYEKPYGNGWYYDFYVKELDLHIEITAGLRPDRINEKIAFNKANNINYRVINYSDIYKKDFILQDVVSLDSHKIEDPDSISG